MSKRRQLPEPIMGELSVRRHRPLPKPPARPTLPAPHVRSPDCGACWQELEHDGDSFYCDTCGLDYGDGREDTPATYRDPETLPCAKPCAVSWHQPSREWSCAPCSLPTGHQDDCWCDCQVVMP